MDVVLDVVAEDERRSMLPQPPAAQLLAHAESFDRDAAGELDQAGAPRRATARGAGVRTGQLGIGFEFGAEMPQVRAGLLAGGGDDPDVRLAAFDRGAERIAERGERALGAAARGEDVEPGAALAFAALELCGEPGMHP
jgi:hypothetical protein